MKMHFAFSFGLLEVLIVHLQLVKNDSFDNLDIACLYFKTFTIMGMTMGMNGSRNLLCQSK